MNEEIKQLRVFLGKSQSEFAFLLGVSVDSVRKWEQGKVKPSHKAMDKIAIQVDLLKKLKEHIKNEEGQF